MYTNTIPTAASWLFSTTGATGNIGGNGEGNAFSKLFDSIRNGSKSNFEDILGKLSERFPDLSFKPPPASGAGSVDNQEAAPEEIQDTAEIDENALAEMSASEAFSSLVEKALSSFLDATKNMPSSMNGVNTIRSISITVTTATFSVNQTNGSTGETLMSQELQTALKEKIDEMINKVFGIGGGGSEGETEETQSKDETAASTEPARANENPFNFGHGMSGWSMQLYYSQSFLQDSAGNSMQSWNAGFSMQGLTTSFIPEELSRMMNEGGSLDQLREQMSGFGLSISGFNQSWNGVGMRIGESRNLLSELLEALDQRNQQSRPSIPAASPEPDEDEDAAEVEAAEVEEVAAE